MPDIAMPTLVEEEVKNDFPRMGVIAALVNIHVIVLNLNIEKRDEGADSEVRKVQRQGRNYNC